MSEPITDPKTGEMLCDNHCGGECNPKACDCAKESECETEETLPTLDEDMHAAVYDLRKHEDATYGDKYHNAMEGASWIRKAFEDTTAHKKDMQACLDNIWDNAKAGDTYTAAVMANALADHAMDTAAAFIRLAVNCQKTADSVGD